MNQLLEYYKKLPDKIKENLSEFLSYKTCYDTIPDISDEMVMEITSLAKDCWLKDEYSQSGLVNYIDYLLDLVTTYEATKEEISNLNVRDIVSAFNDEGEDKENLLMFDTSDLDYCFTTKDSYKYYYNDDGLYIVNEKGRLIQSPNPMEDPNDTIFNLLEKNEITDIPLRTHYDIRCIIKNDILGDYELEERYKNAIDNYKKICKDKFITSRDILNKVNVKDINIDVTELDYTYTDEEKLKKLSRIINKLSVSKIEDYSYVASFDNGVDFYFCNKNNKYIAVDNNFITKEFDDDKYLILKELKPNQKIVYISESERNKIAKSLNDNYENINFRSLKETNAITQFIEYENNRELNSLGAKAMPLQIQVVTANMYNEQISKQLNEYKSNEKDIDM